MNTLKDYVEWKLTHSDKVAEAEGYPLLLENCKKNKRMKDFKVYGNSVQNGTPTPENPIEVQSVGEKTKNLYDAKTYPPTDGNCIWSTSGGVGLSDNMSSTKHIPCSELRGKTITCGCGSSTNPGVAFYDDDKVYISGKGYAGKSTLTTTVPENASYFRWCYVTDQKDQAMIVEGNTFGDYEPYGKYKLPIVQRGKNLFDLTKRGFSSATNLQSLDNGLIVKGSVSTSTSAIAASKGWFFVGQSKDVAYIKTKPNTNITISFDITPQEILDATITPQTRIIARQSIYSPEYSLELGVKSHISWTVTPKSGWDDLYFTICLCSQVMKIENIQVEYGDSETPYEPYVKPITYNVFIDEPLSANDILDVKEHMQLPKLTTKTTIFETDTEVKPSKMYGKYIK